MFYTVSIRYNLGKNKGQKINYISRLRNLLNVYPKMA